MNSNSAQTPAEGSNDGWNLTGTAKNERPIDSGGYSFWRHVKESMNLRHLGVCLMAILLLVSSQKETSIAQEGGTSQGLNMALILVIAGIVCVAVAILVVSDYFAGTRPRVSGAEGRQPFLPIPTKQFTHPVASAQGCQIKREVLMNEVLSSQERPSHPPQAQRHWPWGQLAVFLFGSSMCLTIDRAAIGILEITIVWIIEKLAWAGSLCFLAALACGVRAFVVQRRARNDGSKILFVPWLRRANIAVWSTFFLVMLLSMLIPAFVSAYQAAQRAESQKLVSRPWNVHSFANDSFQLSTPANWELVPDPSLASAGIRLIDPLNDSFLMSSVVPKRDLAVTSLDAFRQRLLQTLQQSTSDLMIEKSHPSRIDGHPAVVDRMVGTPDGVNVIFLSCLVEYPDRWVEVRLGTTRSRFPENEAMFEKIVSTLQQKK